MYGGTVKTLRVSYQGTGVSKTELWSKTGDQGNQWFEAEMNVPAVGNLKVYKYIYIFIYKCFVGSFPLT